MNCARPVVRRHPPSARSGLLLTHLKADTCGRPRQPGRRRGGQLLAQRVRAGPRPRRRWACCRSTEVRAGLERGLVAGHPERYPWSRFMLIVEASILNMYCAAAGAFWKLAIDASAKNADRQWTITCRSPSAPCALSRETKPGCLATCSRSTALSIGANSAAATPALSLSVDFDDLAGQGRLDRDRGRQGAVEHELPGAHSPPRLRTCRSRSSIPRVAGWSRSCPSARQSCRWPP